MRTIPKSGLRFTALSVILGAVCVASAQNLTEDAINQSFAALRAETTLHLRIEGTMTRAGVARNVRADGWFKQEPGPAGLAKIELREQVADTNGNWQTINRIVGDGVNLYRYNFQTYEASSIQYGSPVGDITADYTPRLFRYFSSTPTLVDDFLPRMLKEVCAGDASNYRRWMPGRDPALFPDRIVYTQTAPVNRSFEFSFNIDGSLASIHRNESRTIGNQVNSIDWTLQVIVLPGSYEPFVPYQRADIPNWRMVSWFTAAGSGF